MDENVELWMCKELGKLGIDASEENAKYILGIETAEELEEYMLELLDGSNPKTKVFIKKLLVKWRPYSNSAVPGNMQVYMKPKEEESFITGKGGKKKSNRHERNSPHTFLQNGHETKPQTPELLFESKQPVTDKEVKKKKFVPLFSKEGSSKDVIQLQGRHVCECQAAKHKLIGNCTRCGRVVCEQEGSGPCLFCGKLVCNKEEEGILARGSKKSEKLRQSLMKNGPERLLNETLFNGDRNYLPNRGNQMTDGATKAEQHKEKLLEYDKTSVRRTQVIDDESDYFSTDSNQWLSKTDREALRKREEELRGIKYASRKDRKITLDFAGRQVIEEDQHKSVNMYDVNDDVVQQVHYGARPKVKDTEMKGVVDSDSNGLVNPNIQQLAPIFVGKSAPSKPKASTSSTAADKRPAVSRIQDRELQEMSDEGVCMSMHQPWASLLVCGIKIHEGRTWYTPHRGRLWIAATAKAPDPAEVADVEQTYRYILKNPNIEFPSHYPVGCLLGCVDVGDCLAHEDYEEKFPEGESGSPFVFICENPQQLVVKFPIKGKHKIYKLESHIHKAAKKGLR